MRKNHIWSHTLEVQYWKTTVHCLAQPTYFHICCSFDGTNLFRQSPVLIRTALDILYVICILHNNTCRRHYYSHFINNEIGQLYSGKASLQKKKEKKRICICRACQVPQSKFSYYPWFKLPSLHNQLTKMPEYLTILAPAHHSNGDSERLSNFPRTLWHANT